MGQERASQAHILHLDNLTDNQMTHSRSHKLTTQEIFQYNKLYIYFQIQTRM